MVDIGTLFGASGGSEGDAINARGQIVGASNSATFPNGHAFFWDERSGMQDLGVFPGDLGSGALGINSSAQIVGSSTISNDPLRFRAVLWTRSPHRSP
jgi:probable HAF family extracellular repeat protein